MGKIWCSKDKMDLARIVKGDLDFHYCPACGAGNATAILEGSSGAGLIGGFVSEEERVAYNRQTGFKG